MPDHGDLAALGEALRADIFSLIGAPDEWRDLTDLGQEAAALWQGIDQQFGALATWLTSPLLSESAFAAGDFLADGGEGAPSERRPVERAEFALPSQRHDELRGDVPFEYRAPRAERSELDRASDTLPTRYYEVDESEGPRMALIGRAETPFTDRLPFAQPSPEDAAERFAAQATRVPHVRDLPVEAREPGGLPRNSAAASAGRNTSPEPPIKEGSREAKRPFSTQNDLAETGESRDEAPLVTYKPVRGLRDLAQALGSQSYSEEQPLTSAPILPTTRLSTPRAVGAETHSSEQGEAVRLALAARRSNPPSAVRGDDAGSSFSERRSAARQAAEQPPANPRESDSEPDGWERPTGVFRAETPAPEVPRETVTLAGSETTSAPPDVDMDDLLDALSRSIVEEYRRFYRS